MRDDDHTEIVWTANLTPEQWTNGQWGLAGYAQGPPKGDEPGMVGVYRVPGIPIDWSFLRGGGMSYRPETTLQQYGVISSELFDLARPRGGRIARTVRPAMSGKRLADWLAPVIHTVLEGGRRR